MMRLRPIEPFSFTHLAIIYLVVFVFEVIAILYLPIIYSLTLLTNSYILATDVRQPHPISRPWLSERADRYPRADLQRYQSILSAEISRYPHAVFQRIGLRWIVLNSQPARINLERGGMAVVGEGTIYLNVSLTKPGRERFLRRAIHHEVFHFIDAILVRAPGAGADWAKLNPPDFVYGGDEILEALETTNERPDQRAETPGLLNYYSMVSAKEDRAELFSYMVVSPDALKTAADEDVIIREKISSIKRQLGALSRDFDTVLRSSSPSGAVTVSGPAAGRGERGDGGGGDSVRAKRD